MLLKYIYDDRLAQASYFLACTASGEALVIDPARDISPYLKLAEANGVRITHVAETHIHADYISGGHELAAKTGATLYVSGEGDGELAYDMGNLSDSIIINYIKDNVTFMVGNVTIKAIHTPGHTPEHMSYMVTDRGVDMPMGIFTGDFIFVGDVGRPDLLDATGMLVGSRKGGAKQQFQSVQMAKTLPDYLQIWPGHGAGSACGKALGAIPSTTLGYEKLFNPAFQKETENDFVDWLLDGQPEAPRYFAQMKRVNRVGAVLLSSLPDIERCSADKLTDAIENGMVIDTRDSLAYAQNNLKGTVNVPITYNNFSTWAGWYVDFDEPVYLIVEDTHRDTAINALRDIGVDKIMGTFTPDMIPDRAESIAQIDVKTIQANNDITVLDVRGRGEREERHIPQSLFIPMGEVPEHINELSDKQLAVQCGSGVRSMIVASILRNYGVNVVNLDGGISAWETADLPLNRGG